MREKNEKSLTRSKQILSHNYDNITCKCVSTMASAQCKKVLDKVSKFVAFSHLNGRQCIRYVYLHANKIQQVIANLFVDCVVHVRHRLNFTEYVLTHIASVMSTHVRTFLKTWHRCYFSKVHHIEGSIHKGSISIYFWFPVFTPSDRSEWARQACDISFSNFTTQEKL